MWIQIVRKITLPQFILTVWADILAKLTRQIRLSLYTQSGYRKNSRRFRWIYATAGPQDNLHLNGCILQVY